MPKNRICAGIVTFNPNINILKNSLEIINEQVEKIAIFDNASININYIRRLVNNNRRVCLIEIKEKKRISHALNNLCQWAKDNHFSWILTLDQDSQPPSNLVEVLDSYTNDQVAIVSPDIIYKNNERFAVKHELKYEEKEWVITSASLTNINAWERIQGFDEWLFIDGVDYDFCIRARREGYHVICTYEVKLVHELGNLKCKRFFRKIIYVTNHSVLRKYYMTRNTIYLCRKLKKGNPIVTIIKYVIKTIVFEEKKIEKMRAIIKGIADGIKIT